MTGYNRTQPRDLEISEMLSQPYSLGRTRGVSCRIGALLRIMENPFRGYLTSAKRQQFRVLNPDSQLFRVLRVA